MAKATTTEIGSREVIIPSNRAFFIYAALLAAPLAMIGYDIWANGWDAFPGGNPFKGTWGWSEAGIGLLVPAIVGAYLLSERYGGHFVDTERTFRTTQDTTKRDNRPRFVPKKKS